MPFLDAARAPEGTRLYAIGDVHGRLDLLRDVHARVATDLVRRPCPRFRVIHLGDYVDRGPDSAGVVAHLIEFCRDGDAVCLAGNHDLYVTRFLKDPAGVGDHWMHFGGIETLASYGIDAAMPGIGLRSMKAVRKALVGAMPAAHVEFFDKLPFLERHGDYIFVHAGLRPGVKIDRQKVADLTFIREPFLSHDGDFGGVVIHGHTAGDDPVIRPNRIGIDTRAYSSGRLSCLVLEGAEKGFLDPGGYGPLAR